MKISNNIPKILCFIISVKILILFYILFYSGFPLDGSLIERFSTNDYTQLLDPVNNLIETGCYELISGSSIPFTDRLPGYMFPFIFFRFFFSEEFSVLLLIIFQVGMSIIASILLYRLSFKISKNLIVSLIIFTIFNIFSFIIPWELWAVPESLSVSYYIISIYLFFLFYYNSKGLKYLFLSGFFISLVFFLRGFLFFNIMSVGIFLFFRYNFSFFIKTCLIFLLPILIFECIWIGRNYYSTNNFIPLTTFQIFNDIDFKVNDEYPFDYKYKPTILKLRKFISCWGGGNVPFYPDSEMSFFTDSNNTNYDVFPNWIFNCGVSKLKIDSIKFYVLDSYDFRLSEEIRISTEIKLFTILSNSIDQFNYQSMFQMVLVRVNRFKNLIFNNVVSDWPIGSFSSNSIAIKLYKLLILIFYFIVLCIFFLLSPFFLFLNKIKTNFNGFYFIIFMNSVMLVFVFVFVIDVVEFKYTATLFINSLLFISLISNKLSG